MALTFYLSGNLLEKSQPPTTKNRLGVQKKDSYLNNILMLSDCVGKGIV